MSGPVKGRRATATPSVPPPARACRPARLCHTRVRYKKRGTLPSTMWRQTEVSPSLWRRSSTQIVLWFDRLPGLGSRASYCSGVWLLKAVIGLYQETVHNMRIDLRRVDARFSGCSACFSNRASFLSDLDAQGPPQLVWMCACLAASGFPPTLTINPACARPQMPLPTSCTARLSLVVHCDLYELLLRPPACPLGTSSPTWGTRARRRRTLVLLVDTPQECATCSPVA